MSRYWNPQSYAQLSAQELRIMVQQSSEKASQKGREMQPIIIQGREIAHKWWGKAWCQNLERYADYGSRLERGKRYLRSGTVIDLQIVKGKIRARVQGRRATPYKVEIRISPLKEAACQHIMDMCANKIDSLEALIEGDFAEDFKDLFTGENGLFPTPTEINFQCSCPDWALLCKHVAAVLYGIGARLDENPLLFFTLRGIDMDRFIDVTLSNRVEQMLAHADTKSDRIIKDDKIHDLFDVL